MAQMHAAESTRSATVPKTRTTFSPSLLQPRKRPPDARDGSTPRAAVPKSSPRTSRERPLGAMETPVKTGAPPAPPVTPATVAAATPTPSKRMPTATPAPSSTPGPSKPAMSEAELRQKLRPVFDAFDTDGSGAVSTSEMTAMVAKLQMTLGPEEIAKLMADADPDG